MYKKLDSKMYFLYFLYPILKIKLNIKYIIRKNKYSIKYFLRLFLFYIVKSSMSFFKLDYIYFYIHYVFVDVEITI